MSETTNPLAAVLAMESAAFRLGHLARRLTSEHTDAGLIVQDTSVYGIDTGKASGRLVLHADNLGAARAVAEALGIDLAVTASSTPWSVFEHGHGQGDVDGFEVTVSGMRHFTDDEAATWRAKQAAAESGEQ